RDLRAIVDDDVGLEFPHHGIHLDRLPAFCVKWPGHVVPEDVYLAVVRHQLAHLSVNVIDETPARRFIRLAKRAVRVMPVHQRIVETEAQTFSASGFNIFTDEIATGTLFRGAI